MVPPKFRAKARHSVRFKGRTPDRLQFRRRIQARKFTRRAPKRTATRKRGALSACGVPLCQRFLSLCPLHHGILRMYYNTVKTKNQVFLNILYKALRVCLRQHLSYGRARFAAAAAAGYVRARIPALRVGAQRGFLRTAKLFIGAGAPDCAPFHRRKRAGRGTLSAYLILCVRAFHLISSGTFGQCRGVLYFAPSTAKSVISHAGMHGVRRR